MEELNQLFDDAYIASCLYDCCDACHREFEAGTLTPIYSTSGRIGLTCGDEMCTAGIVCMLQNDLISPRYSQYSGAMRIYTMVVWQEAASEQVIDEQFSDEDEYDDWSWDADESDSEY